MAYKVLRDRALPADQMPSQLAEAASMT